MSPQSHWDAPSFSLPPCLEGLEPPVSVQEALSYAEARGASPEFLRYMESLPAGVYTSEEGMRRAFAHLHPEELELADPDMVEIPEDGISS